METRSGTLLSCFRFGRLDCCYETDDKEYLRLQVDKDTVLHGIRLFGSESNEYEVFCPRMISAIVHRSGTFSSVHLHCRDFHYHGFNIMFDPVSLRKDVYYN